MRKVGGKELSPKTKPSGYQEVSLKLESGKGTSRYVHRLVAETFLGPIKKGFCVNHKNGIKTDNSLKNLEIITFSENSKHAIENGFYKPPVMKGQDHPLAKLNENEVIWIRTKYKETKSFDEIKTNFPNTPLSTLRKVAYGYTWKHIRH